MTPRLALGWSAIGAGMSYGNLAVALPLLVLADDRSTFYAGALIGVNTLAFSVGALLALGLRRAESGVAIGLVAMALGDVGVMLSPVSFLPVGVLANGVGMGLFWVGVQGAIGRRAGVAESQHAFVGQYAAYVFGTASGAAATGLGVALARALGAGDTTSIKLTFVIGAAATVTALPVALSWLSIVRARARERRFPTPFMGLALQSPDLLLVGAMGMLLSLVPVVLSGTFYVSPLLIGIVSALVAGAKIAGSFTAGRLVLAIGSKNTVGAMLTASAVMVMVLAGTRHVWIFVIVTFAVAFFAIGAWPIVVVSALARVSPRERANLTIIWNVREYTVIATTTAIGGYLLSVSSSPALMLGADAVLLVFAAVAALTVYRKPVYSPATA